MNIDNKIYQIEVILEAQKIEFNSICYSSFHTNRNINKYNELLNQRLLLTNKLNRLKKIKSRQNKIKKILKNEN